MIVTEQEARELWCPMARVSQFENGGGYVNDNRGGQIAIGDVRPSCIGSQCMAWTWGAHAFRQRRWADDPSALVEPPRPADVPPSWTFHPEQFDGEDTIGAHWREPQNEADRRRVGCCGIAGTGRLP